MGYFLSLLVLLFSLNANAVVTPSIVNSIGVGGNGANPPVSIIPLANPAGGTGTSAVFSLYGQNPSNNANGFFPFFVNGSPYKVGMMSGCSTSVKAYCFDISAQSSTTGSSLWQLVSSTLPFINTATTIFGPIYQGGATGIGMNTASTTAYVPYNLPGVYTFNQQIWAGFQMITASDSLAVHMHCYEQ